MLYLIKSAHLIKKSVHTLENDEYCSVFKVGYAKEITRRYSEYKTENVSCDLIKSREGDKFEEYMLHLILRGLGLNIDRGREWYKLDQKVLEIFDKSFDELRKILWENRDKYFPKGMFHISTSDNNKFRSLSHKIFSELYEEFVPEEEKPHFGEEVYLGKDCQVISQEVLEIDQTYRHYLDLKNKKISQKDYQDNITVTRSLESVGATTSEFDQLSEVISDFLINEFFSTGKFKSRMRSYCRFRDKYVDSPEVVEELSRRIRDPRYSNYYEYYGSRGCGSRQFEEKKLLEGLKSKTKLNTIGDHIYSLFEIGKKYSMFEIKEDLVKLFKEVGITDKKPTSTLLQDYFEMSRTKITLPDKTLVNGFKILGRKNGAD